MARFRVHVDIETGGYLLDVQANLLDDLRTCVVVPLLSVATAPRPAAVLNPAFDIDGTVHVMATQFLAAVPRRVLGKVVLNLEDQSHLIVAALDCLFQGI